MKTKGPYFFKKVIKIPIYEGNFMILFSDDKEKVCRTVNFEIDKISHLYAHTFHNFLYNKFETFAVCFNMWGKSPITTGTIVHEVNHAANRLMLSREFNPDFVNDEAECYLKGWMTDEVVNFMKKCKLV